MDWHDSSFDKNLEVKNERSCPGIDSNDDPRPGLTFTLRTRDMRLLTYREWEVLELVELGYAREQIQHELHFSRQTLDRHLNSMCSKLKIRDCKEAPEVVRSLGFIAS